MNSKLVRSADLLIYSNAYIGWNWPGYSVEMQYCMHSGTFTPVDGTVLPSGLLGTHTNIYLYIYIYIPPFELDSRL